MELVARLVTEMIDAGCPIGVRKVRAICRLAPMIHNQVLEIGDRVRGR